MSVAPTDRRHPSKIGKDQRHEFARDRDRILYCSAFRRLAGVTQVVGVAEGHVFHNRLTHSMKVAQVGRRLAEMLVQMDGGRAETLWIDPEVVEAAALAHDLGHPPFGHVGEATLNECMTAHGRGEHGESGGYEGNAQSFRIVTTLAMRREEKPGLNLTRATLNAILKYPWIRVAEGEHAKKWGAYHSEKDDLSFARADTNHEEKSASAFLMDWADDITYSVHDIEDFYRAGVVPLDRLAVDLEERGRYLEAMFPKEERAATAEILDGLMGLVVGPLRQPFYGNRDQRGALRGLVSTLVERFVLGVTWDDSPTGLKVHDGLPREVEVLKRIMRHYVFAHPALAAQQYGQRVILTDVFTTLLDLALEGDAPRLPKSRYVLPVSIRYDVTTGQKDQAHIARIVCDAIASMTEQQVLALHARLKGVSLGSISNKIVF